MEQKGEIKLICGPMFSGKSTELQRLVRRYKLASKKCLIVNFIADSRYNNDECVTTHDKQTLIARKVTTLSEIDSIYQQYDVIAIDEGQFFSDVIHFLSQAILLKLDIACEKFANKGKIVIIAALDADFRRQPFGKISDLLPLCESFVKLAAICEYCGREAHFTLRTTASKEIEVIGGSEMYKPVCRACYLNYSKIQEEKNQEQIKVKIEDLNQIIEQAKVSVK